MDRQYNGQNKIHKGVIRIVNLWTDNTMAKIKYTKG